MSLELYGFRIKQKNQENDDLRSIARDPNDGSMVITIGDNANDLIMGGAFGYGQTFDVDPNVNDEAQLITKYREVALVPEVKKAIDIIINEMISGDKLELVSLDLDGLEASESTKKMFRVEFDHIVNLLNFNGAGYKILRKWYVDGRFPLQVVVDPNRFKDEGIGKLTYIDPRKLKKVRIYKKTIDQRTQVDEYQEDEPHYLYSESGFSAGVIGGGTVPQPSGSVIRLSDDAVVFATSGLLNPSNTVILSYLHGAIRPLNMLTGLENAKVIYNLTRAPERRVFYLDVGDLPPAQAEAQLRRQMMQYRTKPVFDAASGMVKSDPKVTTMIEDYWLPRRSDGKATEVSTLSAGQLSNDVTDVNYYLNKLYSSLNVPVTRLDPNAGFSLGRTTEISRDEVAFHDFIVQLRNEFSELFLDLLKRQLTLKGLTTPAEFETVRNSIRIQYTSHNRFDEMMEMEILTSRIDVADRLIPYVGPTGYFSKTYVWKEIFKMSDEDIERMKKELDEEVKQGLHQMGDEEEGDTNFTRVMHSTAPKAPTASPGGAATQTKAPAATSTTSSTTVNATTTSGSTQSVNSSTK